MSSPLSVFPSDTLRRIYAQNGSSNTSEGGIIRAGGKHATNTITLNANNTSAAVNIFVVTGPVDIRSLHGEVTVATTLTNLTDAYFDLWDGTVSVPLTKATGATLSGAGVGSFFLKTDVATAELTVLLNNQARISEVTGNRTSQHFIAVAKTSAPTYIRFRYTTTDAPINAQLKIDCTWVDIDSGEVEPYLVA